MEYCLHNSSTPPLHYSHTNMKTLFNISRNRRRGQSLIVAVIVLFVLLFIGGIFVGIVGRNLINTGRARETLSAHEFGRAGIKYCEYFLQHSAEGADWRPAPTPLNLAGVGANDPDRRWLDPNFQDPPFSRI